jgi:threonine/homoserine/homoserine lactone efflux protein
MSPEFLLTSLVVVATPGTGVVYTLAAGLARGSRASIVAAAGCTVGVLPHMAAAITGLAALLHTSAVAFGIVKYLGVAYLLYLAWSTRRGGELTVDAEADDVFCNGGGVPNVRAKDIDEHAHLKPNLPLR